MSLVQKARGISDHICPSRPTPTRPSTMNQLRPRALNNRINGKGSISQNSSREGTITLNLFSPSLKATTAVRSNGTTVSVVPSIRILIEWPFDLRTFMSSMWNPVMEIDLQLGFDEHPLSHSTGIFLPRAWSRQVNLQVCQHGMTD